MKKLILTIIFTVCFGGTISAQVYPSSVFVTQSGRSRTTAEIETAKRIYDNQRTSAEMGNLRAQTENIMGNSRTEASVNVQKRVKKYITPDSSYQSKYQAFLKLPDTGIVSLMSKTDCGDNNDTLKSLTKKCPFKFVFGGGEYFSFRRKDYVYPEWSDIQIKGDWIYSFGVDNQGILVDLGDINLEVLSLTSKGIDNLAAFSPSSKIEEVQAQSKKLLDIMEIDKFQYAKVLPLEVNKTYGLRVVAYQKDIDAELSDQPAYKVNASMQRFDTRKDIIVAFKIIGKDENGKVTLIWKEIQRKESPKLEIAQPKQ